MPVDDSQAAVSESGPRARSSSRCAGRGRWRGREGVPLRCRSGDRRARTSLSCRRSTGHCATGPSADLREVGLQVEIAADVRIGVQRPLEEQLQRVVAREREELELVARGTAASSRSAAARLVDGRRDEADRARGEHGLQELADSSCAGRRARPARRCHRATALEERARLDEAEVGVAVRSSRSGRLLAETRPPIMSP